MWLFLSNGFLSIVEHRHKPDFLLVRARNMEHLKTIFPNAECFSLKNSDYPHRAIIAKSEVSKVIADYISNLSYDNYKNSISESKFSKTCNHIWHLMFNYGLKFRR